MSTEEDRAALAQILNQHDPEGGSYINDPEGNLDLSWWYPQVDAILAAGFHRTPAPAPDVQALIDEAREHLAVAADAAPRSARAAILAGDVEDQRMSLVARLADALEATLVEHDRIVAERAWDEGFDAGRDDLGAAAVAIEHGEDENPYRKEGSK